MVCVNLYVNLLILASMNVCTDLSANRLEKQHWLATAVPPSHQMTGTHPVWTTLIEGELCHWCHQPARDVARAVSQTSQENFSRWLCFLSSLSDPYFEALDPVSLSPTSLTNFLTYYSLEFNWTCN